MDRAALWKVTQDSWPGLLRMAGLDPDSHVPARRWERFESGRAQIVVQLDAPRTGPVVFKQIHQPQNPAAVTAAVEAQSRASEALRGHAFARAPRILAHDPQRQAMLMTHARGETLASLCERTERPDPHLERAGAWLAAFHRAGPTEERPYRPRYMTDHLNGIAENLRQGRRSMAGKGEFLTFLARLGQIAADVDGRPTVSAARHGDPIDRNILIGAEHVWGIDFSAPAQGPVGFDLSRLIVSHAEAFVDVADLAPGRLLPDARWAALHRGYDLSPPDDPVTAFLGAVRLLTNWASLPGSVDAMSVAQVVRLRRLRLLARHVLG